MAAQIKLDKPTTTPRKAIPLIALFAANAVSMTGNALALVALPWFVLETTSSASATGLTGFFETLPIVIALFLGGDLIDRLGHKRSSIVADLASSLSVALIPILHLTVGLAFWQLLLLVFMGALLDAPGTTARQVLLPEVAARAGVLPERTNALYQIVQRASLLIGPPLAGLLIVAVNASTVLLLDTLTFLLSAFLIGWLVPGKAKPATNEKGFLVQLREGWQFVWRDKLLLSIIVTVTLANFLDTPLLSVLLPVFSKSVYRDPTSLGLLLAVFGGGSIVSAMVFAAIGPQLPRRAVLIAAFGLHSTLGWIFATLPILPLALLSALLSGLASGPLNPLIMTVAQERVPFPMRGRVFGLMTGLALTASPLGLLIAGYVVEGVGIGTAFLIIGLCYIGVVASLLFNPVLRQLDHKKGGASVL